MKGKNRQKLLVILAASAAGLFFLDQVILTALKSSWQARATRISELRKKVTDGQSMVQREQSLRARWRFIQANALPNNRSLAEQQVLKAFDRWSQESRISILSINPQWKQDAEEYVTLECRVEAAGDLSTITRFLYDIEKDPMALKLQNLELSARDTEGKQLALGLQVSGLVLTAEESKR
ncbi:MAG TPA: type 4a pilus biogenesis protein PilO [Candidatus Sulfotelmatobacter sp.]|nr:type 4a pilus biogenesis protein PilO [Candidatus Sulfotelmatobacter sp.]HWI60107.1 type 4a pilus biogenesis protein PilO [Bacillota bacterium]